MLLPDRAIKDDFVSTPSNRTLYADMLRLCARIGYSPPLHS